MEDRSEERASWPPVGWIEPKRIDIDAGAVTLSALVYGDPTAPAIVLMHGWADSAWTMDSVAQPLADRYRVINVDLRGHGHSDRGPYNLMHLIGDARGVVETLDLTDAIFIGHSLGAQVLAQLCGLYPTIPRALVMVEGTGPPPHRLSWTDPALSEREFARNQVERVRKPVAKRPLASPAQAVERMQRGHPLLDPARAAFLAEKNTVTNADGELMWRFDPNSRDWINGHNHHVAELRWQGIVCPTLIVNASDSYDRYWRFLSEDPADYPRPLAGELLAAKLSNFADHRYVEIAGAGHMVPYDKPDELNVAIEEFLREL